MSGLKQEVHNFTTGPILSKLIRFSLPVLLALLLLATYGAVDLMIVGQFAASSDVAAVATGSNIMLTFTAPLSSFAMGITVLLGLIPAAGIGVAEKVCAFVMLVPSSFMQSMAAFTAQNIGAGKSRRALQALRYGIGASLTAGAVIGAFTFFRGDLLCNIFSKGNCSEPPVYCRTISAFPAKAAVNAS